MSDLVGNPEDWFSRVAAHIIAVYFFLIMSNRAIGPREVPECTASSLELDASSILN